MDPYKQWRIENGQHLAGAPLRQQPWQTTQDSDHAHCSCCWAKFAEWDAPGIQHTGYVTTTRPYAWICEQCFKDLCEALAWTLPNHKPIHIHL